MTPAREVVREQFALGLKPDPNMTVDEWSDRYMIIPKDSGANEYGKYRTSRTPHAREIMRALSDNHPCKRVVLMGASQMLKTQVGLNWFACSVHQSPANFLWILPTGKLAKRTSTRVSKTISAVPELRERVAAPRSRDSINTLDTKEYQGGALYIVTAGAAANLSEVPARRVLFDEVDRAVQNVNGEGDPVELGEARQTTFERNRKSYYPSSPTITDESTVEKLYLRGTRREALADCVHCGHAQPLVFERLKMTEDGQEAMYPCADCGAVMYETDKNKMFARGAWSEGVPGDGETESFTINGMFLPYGWIPWKALWKQYQKALDKLAEGDETAMIVFYNTRLARSWERKKEQTKYSDLMARAEHVLGTVPKGGLILTMAVDTQPDRLEAKVVAWGEGMENWVVDYQILFGSPAEADVWKRLDEVLAGRYRHDNGRMLPIAATFIDSGGANTQDVYNYVYPRQYLHVFAIKGASTPNKPILSGKPSMIDVTWQGATAKQGVKLWFIGTDTAKDYFASRYKLVTGPGATHFPKGLPEEYYKQLTAEYSITAYKRGRKVRIWEKKKSDRNEAGDIMNYNLAAAHYLGLHRKTAAQWQAVRDRVDPITPDLFAEQPDPDVSVAPSELTEQQHGLPSSSPAIEKAAPWNKPTTPSSQNNRSRRPVGRQW